jgi:hypothetical protein
MKLLGRQTLRGSLLYTLAISAVAIGRYLGVAAVFGERAVPEDSAQQQDLYLSRRIDQVEQRFFQIESRLNRLEMQPKPSTITSPSAGGDETELRLLRAEISSMRVRLGEAECALLRLDERTLTNAARLARKKAGDAGTENCRRERDVSIQLSARP